jgi:sterol desaturase/sphingolipid hydroxylase (fatty acid hydroxylase superfamily)
MIVQYFDFAFIVCFIANMLQMTILTSILNILDEKKKYYTPGERKDNFDIINYYKTILINTFSYYIINKYISIRPSNIIQNVIYFIPKSFIFELIFDLGHYTTHRLLHSIPILYRYIHKKHHEDNLINIYTTYNHTILDYLITNTMPLIVTSCIVPMSRYEQIMMKSYKSITELSGHTGKKSNSSSFIQCIWFARLLRIELKNEDHNNHHEYSTCNYSKRFSIWDKVFNTYKKI